MEQKNYPVTITDLPASRIKIQSEIGADEFAAARPDAIRHLSEHASIPGFRKGKIPESVLLARIGEDAILGEMVDVAINRAYPHIVVANKLDVIGRPELNVESMAIGSPLKFSIETAIFPKFAVADYKAVAKEVNKSKEAVVVTDDEVKKTIDEVKKVVARVAAQKEGKEVAEDIDAATLPALTDEDIKNFGPFENVAAFEKAIRENLATEKEKQAKDKVRIGIMEKLVKDTAMELPEILVIQELARMEDEFAGQIARMGFDMESYLTKVGKTREDMHKEWQGDAIARAKTQIIAAKIAELEHLEPSKEDMEREIAALKSRYPNAEDGRVEGFVRMILENEKVFTFLEEQK